MTDEEILYNSYLKLAAKNAAKKKKVDPSKDKALISGISSSASLMLMRLTSEDMLVSMVDIQKYVISVKGMYQQYSTIKGRNPSCVSKSMTQSMDKLIWAVSKREAEMIRVVRTQETGGDRIDINSIFEQKKNLNKLGSMLAVTIVSDAIRDPNNPVEFISTFYITDTGKKFHRADCPYCKGRRLTAATQKMVENQKLTPCKCLSDVSAVDDIDHTCVTAFVDESIHPVVCDDKGHKGKAGSFSYIICWGKLSSESQITDGRIIAQGVDYTGEHEHVERITESAVGKVLMTLAYDYEFTGQVHIFTDNQPAAVHWKDVAKNSKLAGHFLSVKVSFIPREMNKKADQLGRTRMLLDMPISAYNEMVNKCARVKELEKRVRKLNTAKTISSGDPDTKIPGVIVANRIVNPKAEENEQKPIKSKQKGLLFENMRRYIKSWFGVATTKNIAEKVSF